MDPVLERYWSDCSTVESGISEGCRLLSLIPYHRDTDQTLWSTRTEQYLFGHLRRMCMICCHWSVTTETLIRQYVQREWSAVIDLLLQRYWPDSTFNANDLLSLISYYRDTNQTSCSTRTEQYLVGHLRRMCMICCHWSVTTETLTRQYVQCEQSNI